MSSISTDKLDSPHRLADVKRVWRNGGLKRSTSAHYEQRLYRFARYCQAHSLDQRTELTERGSERFARWWHFHGSPRRGKLRTSITDAHAALRAWSLVLGLLGESMPTWKSSLPSRAYDPQFQAFARYLRDVRGNSPQTIAYTVAHLTAFERFRRSNGASARRAISLSEIDAYIIFCGKRFARKTVAGICSAIRGYLKFLHVSGAVNVNLAASVVGPIVRPLEQPHRALPWSDVRKILRAVDRKTSKGRRDYALLLMMSMYGFGAGEVIGIRLDDINWQAATIRVKRPKTGSEFDLPLLPAVGRAIVDYLRHGRPEHASERHLFLTKCIPFRRLAGSSTVRHILHSAARRAKVTAPFLGTHALRHTHACRQLELGTTPKVIGDILGHRNPTSTSAYVRVASNRLRKLSLPVPV